MNTVDLPRPRRALAIGAHPDDVELYAGATLAKWAAAGTRVEILVLTDGSKGSWDPSTDRSALVATREAEQRAAGRVLRVAALHHLGRVDGELDSDLAARAEVCATIRAARPDVVFGHDPWKRYRLHPDHRHAGWLAVEGIVAARDPHFFPDAGPPHRPTHLLLFEADEPDHLERVAEHLTVKAEALRCHQSQWRSTFGIDPTTPSDAALALLTEQVRVRAATAGESIGAPAEAFKALTDL